MFHFHRDAKHLALYSELYEWANAEDEIEKLMAEKHSGEKQPSHDHDDASTPNAVYS